MARLDCGERVAAAVTGSTIKRAKEISMRERGRGMTAGRVWQLLGNLTGERWEIVESKRVPIRRPRGGKAPLLLAPKGEKPRRGHWVVAVGDGLIEDETGVRRKLYYCERVVCRIERCA